MVVGNIVNRKLLHIGTSTVLYKSKLPDQFHGFNSDLDSSLNLKSRNLKLIDTVSHKINLKI